MSAAALERWLAGRGVAASPARDLAVRWCGGSGGRALLLLELGPESLRSRLEPLILAPATVDPSALLADLPWNGEGSGRAAEVERVGFYLGLLPRIGREVLHATAVAGDPAAGYSPAFIECLGALVEACVEATDALALQIHPELVWEALAARLARGLGARVTEE
jgi:hypothetical protein